MYKTIVCPVDLSDVSFRALRHAFMIARSCGGEVIIVHASSKVLTDDQETMLRISLEQFHQDEIREIQRVDAVIRDALESPELKELVSGIAHTIHTISAHDDDAWAIIEFARNIQADLITITCRGRSAVIDALLGGAADTIIKKATCPVLVVHLND